MFIRGLPKYLEFLGSQAGYVGRMQLDSDKDASTPSAVLCDSATTKLPRISEDKLSKKSVSAR